MVSFPWFGVLFVAVLLVLVRIRHGCLWLLLRLLGLLTGFGIPMHRWFWVYVRICVLVFLGGGCLCVVVLLF